MSTTTDVSDDVDRTDSLLLRAGAAGLLAGVAFGLLIQFRLQRMTAIGAMYTLGDPSLTVGWVAHILHSVVFGALFGLLVDRPPLRQHVWKYHGGVGLALAYAVALWAVNIVFLWPLWLNGVGFGADLPLPNLARMPLVGHVVYGLLLGLFLAAFARLAGEGAVDAP
ncbi:hypothetical protein [Haloarchaeobius salinus]|uniref:hypothetical protein n=1 Tax=Haloarchaeobius salinus TaxID=1198298 RepID=UPI00210ACDE7|nr:hypothetical protein [Haloarchaeobius salinus]